MNRRRRKKLTKSLVGAAMCDEGEEVARLLRAGADPAAPDADGTTPLYAACVQGHAGIARTLLAAGAPPDAESAGPGAEGTPLCAAACWGYTETVRTLLAHGADPGLREDHGTGWTPLQWAQAGPHPETAAALRAAGAGRELPGGGASAGPASPA
ncbi:ankyrin repeat domain-containing protein [Streptomyces sp. NPDC000345]|uniref:ankyrin repeat domain-containing protein n=1 Tax=Streptomyces sp. NPDC000345 TaxID=3364537 RepID=UPI00369B5C09